jgi:hypothetical protein
VKYQCLTVPSALGLALWAIFTSLDRPGLALRHGPLPWKRCLHAEDRCTSHGGPLT